MLDEMLDIIEMDENGVETVIGSAPRSLVRQQGLLHRVTTVLPFTPTGQLTVQRGAHNLERYGFCLSVCGGHVPSGSNYEETALRELQEELQLSTEPQNELSFIRKRRYDDPDGLDSDIKVMYAYVFTPQEFADVLKYRQFLDSMKMTKTKDQYKQWLMSEQERELGAGEVWSIYFVDIEAIEGHDFLMLKEHFKDGYSEDKVGFSASLKSYLTNGKGLEEVKQIVSDLRTTMG